MIEAYCWVAHRVAPHLQGVRQSLLLPPVAWGTRHPRFDRWWWGDIEQATAPGE